MTKKTIKNDQKNDKNDPKMEPATTYFHRFARQIYPLNLQFFTS